MIKYYMSKVMMCMFIALPGFIGIALAAKAGDKYLSPMVLEVDNEGQKLYIALATAKQIAEFDIKSEKITRIFSLPEQPSGLALSPQQQNLYVTLAVPKGQVLILNLKTAKTTSILTQGHTSTAPVVSPDGKILYICNRFSNNIAIIDLASRKVAAKISVPREPIAAAVTADGKYLLVANHLPDGPADKDYTAAKVSIIDTVQKKRVTDILLPNGSTGLRGICVSPDGKHAYATHILARYQLPTTQLERGWMNTNALSVIDITGRKLINTVLLDNVDLGAANPWAVMCTADGEYICVTHAGTHEISVIDRIKLHEKLTKAPSGGTEPYSLSTAENIPNNLAFLVDLQRRIKLKGTGPHGLTIVGTRAYVTEYFFDSISVVDIGSDVRPKVRSIALGPKKPLTKVRKGEMLFNDASICFQHWQSCSSCHPDGRVDGLNWDLLNDGIGNPKNTKNMLLAHKTPPMMVTGIRDKAETAVRAGIRSILFAVRPEEDAEAIDEYLTSLKPLQSPYLVRGKLSSSAKRGKKIFKKAGCAKCHSGTLYTDLKKYNVGTGKDREKDLKFDTPALTEVWRTGPYLLDGRAVTIKEMLIKYNSDDKHGVTSNLSNKEISDLAEYVLTR